MKSFACILLVIMVLNLVPENLCQQMDNPSNQPNGQGMSPPNRAGMNQPMGPGMNQPMGPGMNQPMGMFRPMGSGSWRRPILRRGPVYYNRGGGMPMTGAGSM